MTTKTARYLTVDGPIDLNIDLIQRARDGRIIGPTAAMKLDSALRLIDEIESQLSPEERARLEEDE